MIALFNEISQNVKTNQTKTTLVEEEEASSLRGVRWTGEILSLTEYRFNPSVPVRTWALIVC